MIMVASYCRVSTDKEDQANSFEAQQRYFREYIARQPDWELYAVYADEGITGTSTRKRAQFNEMINDARMGKFRLIITKEVSRFSRNILDTISYTRELRSLGVGVLFMNDAISTLEPDAELRLSIMGSIAQEESRKTSSRVKWGQMRQMADTVTDAARAKAFGDAGVGQVRWITQHDERVCKICRPRDGVIYPLDAVPPKHHNCRCYLIPLAREE